MAAEAAVAVIKIPEKRVGNSRWIVIEDEHCKRNGFTYEDEADDKKTEESSNLTKSPNLASSPNLSGFSFSSTTSELSSSTSTKSGAFNFAENSSLAVPLTSTANVGGGFSFEKVSEPLIGELTFSTGPSANLRPIYLTRNGDWIKPIVQKPLEIDHQGEYLSSVEDFIEQFIQITSDLNATTTNGETALLLVCKAKMKSQVQQNRAIALIESGADVNIAVSACGESGLEIHLPKRKLNPFLIWTLLLLG